MKVLVILCLVVVLAQANDIDWSKVTRPILKVPGLKHLEKKPDGSRIVGGQQAALNQFPYQVAVVTTTDSGQAFCGGSLLSERWVLTAAHCVDSGNVNNVITVILGAHNVTVNEPEQLRIQAEFANIHESWDSSKIVNDIAVVRLSKSVKFNERIQPIRLPRKSQQNSTFTNKIGIVSGWGLSSDWASTISPSLQWVTNPIISNDRCSIYYNSYITKGNICMSGSQGKSTCSGDSGGPLVITDTDGARTQVGIVSFGSSLGCELGYPASFTRVTSFLDWIAEQTSIVPNP